MRLSAAGLPSAESPLGGAAPPVDFDTEFYQEQVFAVVLRNNPAPSVGFQVIGSLRPEGSCL